MEAKYKSFKEDNYQRRWFYYFKSDASKGKVGLDSSANFSGLSNTALCLVWDRYTDQNGCIQTCTDNQNFIKAQSFFGAFDSVYDASTFVDKQTGKNKSIYEYIFGNRRSRMYFDIDVKYTSNVTVTPNGTSTVTSETADFETMKATVLQDAAKFIERALVYYGIAVNEQKLINWYMFESCRQDTETGCGKISYHIVLPFVVENHLGRKEFAEYVNLLSKEIYPEGLIDTHVYGQSQQFRIMGCHKAENNGRYPKNFLSQWNMDESTTITTKLIDPELSPKLCLLRTSMINYTYSDFRVIVPKCRKITTYKDKSYNDAEVQQVINLVNVYDNCLTFSNVTDSGIIVFDRRGSSFCDICQRVHDSSGKYVIVHNCSAQMYCYRFSGEEFCHKKKSTFIGKIEFKMAIVDTDNQDIEESSEYDGEGFGQFGESEESMTSATLESSSVNPPKRGTNKKHGITNLTTKSAKTIEATKSVETVEVIDIGSLDSFISKPTVDIDDDPYADPEEATLYVEDEDLTDTERSLGELYGPLKQLQSFLDGDKMPKFTTTDIAKTVASLILADGTMLIGHKGEGYLYNSSKALWVKCDSTTMCNEFESIFSKCMNSLYCLRPILNGKSLGKDEYHSLIAKAKKYSTADSFGPRLYTRIRRSDTLGIWTNRIELLDQTLDWFPYGKWVINPLTNVIRKRVKEDYFTRSVTRGKMVRAKRNKLVDTVLDQIYCYDRTAMVYHLGSMGAALCGRNSRDIIHSYGGGSNGKSLINDMLARILGDWLFNLKSESLVPGIKKDPDSHNESQNGIEKARIVRIPEASLGRINEEFYKQLAGSDTRIIRGIKAGRMEFRQNFSAFIDTNSYIISTSLPVWDRTKIVKFNARFVSADQFDDSIPNLYVRDRKLKDQLFSQENLDYFFTFVMRCAKELHEMGEDFIPESVIRDTAEAKGEVDYCQQFIDARVIIDPESDVESSALYECFKGWYTSNIGGVVPSMTALGKLMRAKGYRKIKNSTFKYLGLKLA